MSLATYQHRFVPATRAGAPPLLLLHATGGDERQLLSVAQSLAPGSALLAPRGDVSEHGARRFFRRLAEGVFDLDDVRRRTHALADFVAAAAKHYGFDSARLVALGYSNGANLAGTLLLLRPEALGAAALLRPMMVLDVAPSGDALTGRRVLLVNGSHDSTVPADHPARLAAVLQAAGAEVTTRVTPGDHRLVPGDFAAVARWLAPPAGPGS
jgi:phospholipase/carboxylesterase